MDDPPAHATTAWARHLPGNETFRVPPAATLPAAWRVRWAADPRAPALVARRRPGGRPRMVRAGELEERSATIGPRLADGEIAGPGDRVVCLVPPATSRSADWVTALVGLLRAGVVAVPVNGALTAPELAHVLADTKPTAVMAEDELADVARTLLVEATPRRRKRPEVVGLAGDRIGSVPGTPDLSGLVGSTPAATAPALIVFTSGTTGKPKGAVLSQRNLLAGAESLHLAWRLGPEDRLVHTLPLSHVHGLCVGVLTLLYAGATVDLQGGFDADAALAACEAQRSTLFFGVPTMYHRIAASPGAGSLARLRLAVSGSAPLSPALHDRLRDVAGTVVLERYGMTETLLTLSNPVTGERRAGSVGLPLPGVEIDVDEGGELLVRGPTVCQGYWRRSEEPSPFLAGGWFRTGDIAEIEDDGYVRLLGRAKDLIISGGYNVYPAEVEEVLLAHPSVAEVAVVGTASDEWGETVTAWVVPADSIVDVDALRTFAAARLAPYKRPRLVRIVDELPRNAMGKVERHQLRT